MNNKKYNKAGTGRLSYLLKKAAMAAMVLCTAAPLILTGCTDTWDDHYNGTISGAKSGTLWKAIKDNNEQLSNFASVLEATGYDKKLDGSQVLTVFAPTNDYFTEAQAKALIAEYNQQRASVRDEDNSVLNEFVKNHLALYIYTTAEKRDEDSVRLINGKYAVLNDGGVDNLSFVAKNELYENGMLYIVNGVRDYLPNIFEYLRKDSDLDSVRNFFYCGDTLISDRSYPQFYYNEFLPSQSVVGGIDSLGQTVYLDSVVRQNNELFRMMNARLNSEDSTYWMVLPTNEVWSNLVKEYEPMFNYENNVGRLLKQGDRDSLIYLQTRLAILDGACFSRTLNISAFAKQQESGFIKDSLLSTVAPIAYNYRSSYWGANFNYYQYFNAWEPGGVFDQPESQVVTCSNGQVRKATSWPIDKLQTFLRWRIIEAESASSVQDVYKIASATNANDSTNTVIAMTRSVNNTSPYYGKLWSNRFVEFAPQVTTVNPWVLFNIRDVLSNVGYDIYLVTAPALAYNSAATSVQRLPTSIRCTLGYHDQGGKSKTKVLGTFNTLNEKLGYHPDSVNYIKLNSDTDYPDGFKFDVCTYGLNESTPQVTLKVETRVSSSQRDKTMSRTMRIDCILLVPHGTLLPTEALPEDSSIPSSLWGKSAILMYPHGNNPKWFYMPR